MKAKDYAEIYNKEEDKKKAIGIIGAEFARETSRLLTERKAQTASALNGVLREQRLKWIAFCRQTGNEIVEDGFEIVMKAEFPQIASYF
jgi:hypothetical protein